ncbi:MAG: hypothetical protein FWE85_05555 [Clostridiales bacterium]|nr:hypothetical protein [Clostridiales bacterium]
MRGIRLPGMIKIRNIWLLLTIVIFFLAVFMAFLVIKSLFGAPALPAQRDKEGFVSPGTMVRREIYYPACQHLEVFCAAGLEEFAGKTFAEITQDGWCVFWEGDGLAVAFRESGRLCPEDAQKSYLAPYQDRLAIFHGPLGTAGDPLEILAVKPESLPESWRQRLANNGGVEFQTPEELLSALESLDELKER